MNNDSLGRVDNNQWYQWLLYHDSNITVPWEYHDSTWQTFPDLPEVLVTIELRPLCLESKCFTIYVTDFFCYCYSCVVILSTQKILNLMKPMHEVKCHRICFWMLICLFNYGINYEYWLFKISKILKLIFYLPYSMSPSSGLPPH